MKNIWKVFPVMLCIFCIFWCVSLLRCTYLTARHGQEFDLASLCEENTMISPPEWFSVLSYSDTTAKIYCIEKDYSVGTVLKFYKVQGTWNCKGWETVWTSLGGSADGDVWPYFWHSLQYR